MDIDDLIIFNNIEEPDPDDLGVLEFLEFGIPRQIYERANYFETMDGSIFRKRFRLSKETVRNILPEIEHFLEFPFDMQVPIVLMTGALIGILYMCISNQCISPVNQLLTCLRLYSTGGHLDAVADFAGMHTSTVSRIRVSEAIASLGRHYIVFPNDQDEVRRTQQRFFDIAAFPRVIGTIDCSHFKILSPGGNDPEVFRNRKGYFSINGQFVCDADLKILNVVARWPGSTHDSTIFNNSSLKRNFQNNIHRGSLLLGDNGYANNTYLMTPLLNAHTPAEQLYNESHIRTRNTIERLFGVIKRRFPILAYGCRLKIDTFLTIIVATSVLHNIALRMGDHLPPPLPEELDEHMLNQMVTNGQIPNVNNDAQEDIAAASRAQLINNYFMQRL